jgi:formate dehydrogenase (coenzyme F420) alpha subunit
MTSPVKEVKTDSTFARTGCNLNSTGCRINVEVDKGRIVKVEPNPEDVAADLCTRTEGLIEWEYSKERLSKPLKREATGWKEITWDEALDFIAEKLTAIKEKYGARAVVVNTGQGLVRNVDRRAAKRFARAFETPNFTSGDSFCFWSRAVGHTIAFGINDSMANTDFEYSECIFVIGHNPSESGRQSERRIMAAKARGAKLIVVDPRMIPLAKEADIYTPIRPGTDCALILSMLNVIISEKLYDKEFVAKWTHGFDEFAEHVKIYRPEKAAEITWIPADTIRAMARMYAQNHPAAMSSGVAIDHCTCGAQSNWALAIMVAICGNYETDGGNFPVVRLIDQRNADQYEPEASIGYQYPVFSKVCGESTIVPLADAVLNDNPYPVKALLVQCANPALTFPNSNKSLLTFRSLDLLVVMDLFMTETAKLADIVLPSANCLEVKQLRELGTFPPSFSLAVNVIEPEPDRWPLWKFWTELGKKLGYHEAFPWNTADEYFNYYLKPHDLSMKDFEGPNVVYEVHPKDWSYRTNGFKTRSGKVELYSEYMNSLGYDPMPTFREPAEGWVTQPELSAKFPLIMITGSRNRLYHHTQYRNLPSVRRHYPEPMVEINTETAKQLGIASGDMVTVESPRGNIKIKADVTDKIHPDIVSVPHGWSEANVNILTSDAEVDPVSAFIGYKSVLCRVYKE